MDKQIQVTPENVGEWIVKNPQTALCIFKKGMEYHNKMCKGYRLWGYPIEDIQFYPIRYTYYNNYSSTTIT
jgi:hypothetical protein